MKNISKFLVVLIGSVMTLTAYSADNVVTPISGTVSPETDCSLLSQRASLTLSNNVIGAYLCRTATNSIFAATCSTAGSTKPRQVACSCAPIVDEDDIITGYSPNNSQCGCEDDGSVTGAEEGESVNVEVTGRQAFGGSSNGGKIAAFPLAEGGAGECDPASVAGVAVFD
jgi:hypothetical protein